MTVRSNNVELLFNSYSDTLKLSLQSTQTEQRAQKAELQTIVNRRQHVNECKTGRDRDIFKLVFNTMYKSHCLQH